MKTKIAKVAVLALVSGILIACTPQQKAELHAGLDAVDAAVTEIETNPNDQALLQKAMDKLASLDKKNAKLQGAVADAKAAIATGDYTKAHVAIGVAKAFAAPLPEPSPSPSQ